MACVDISKNMLYYAMNLFNASTMNKNHHFWKIFLSIIGVSFGIFLIVFLAMLGYYLWQLKYGDSNSVDKLTEKYEDKFTIASTANSVSSFDKPQSIIRTDNPIHGNSDAPVTIVAFMDFECVYSQESYPILEKILEQYGSAIKLVFKQLPLNAINPYAMNAALGSTCAQEQGKFWEYGSMLFKTKILDENSLYSDASQLGLDISKFTTCLTTRKHNSTIEQDLQDALTVGVRGTPTFIIDTEIIEGVPSQEEWSQLILKHLK